MLGVSGFLILSCVALLGDAPSHFRYLLPLAAFNAAVGAFTPERVARLLLAIEFVAMIAVAGYTVYQVQQKNFR